MANDSALLGGAGASPAGGGAAPSAPTAAPPPPPSFPEKMLSEAQGRFDAVKKVYDQLGRTRKGLDKLVAKGDSVTEDDVLDEMSHLVAHGADPKNLAAMIAGHTESGVGPMPPGGEALAGWLRSAEENLIAPAEAQLRPAMALAQHQLGVVAVHHLLDAHARAAGAQGAAQPPSSALAAPMTAPAASPLLH